MKEQKTDAQKEKTSKLKLKAGIACLGLFALLIVLMLLTSMNGILLSLAIISHISGMFLLATSGYTKGNFCRNRCWSSWKSWGPYSFDYSDPIFRSHHRNHSR